jgi:hypothetical protein
LLRHYATSRKVAGLIPDVNSASEQKWAPGFFLGGRGGGLQLVREAHNVTAICEPTV